MPDISFRDHRGCLTLWQAILDLEAKDGKRLGKRRRLEGGAAIWGPSDISDRTYALERGRVNIIALDERGRELLVQIVTAGESFGELCFCAEDGGIRNSTAVAVADSVVVEASYAAIIQYLQTRGDLLRAVVTTFCARLTDCELRGEALSHKEADQRIGRLLLMLAIRPHQPLRKEAALAVTHRELALLAAMTRSHVTVVLNRFKARGGVSYVRYGPITVHIETVRKLLANGRRTMPRGRMAATIAKR